MKILNLVHLVLLMNLVALKPRSLTPPPWQKTFQAILPCQDCQGIHTMLTLKPDFTFQLERVYLGKSAAVTVQEGPIKLTNNDEILTINLLNQETLFFQVGHDHLYVLDEQQNKTKLKNNENLIMKALGLYNGTFWLEQLNDKDLSAVKTDRIWVVFEPEQLTGFTSCNSLRASVQHEGPKELVTISNTALSKKFCPGNQLEVEFLSTLENIAKYKIERERLSLLDLHDKPLAVFKAGPPN